MAKNIASGAGDGGDFMNLYGYDEQSRMTSVHQRGGTWNGSTIVGGAGVDEKYAEFAWEDDGRLGAISRYTSPAKTTAIGTTNYAYDDRGRIASITYDPASETDDIVYAYQFDSADVFLRPPADE